MSTLCLLTFLFMNGAGLDVSTHELTATALWLATVEAQDFPTIMVELVWWIEAILRGLPSSLYIPDPTGAIRNIPQ
jgi:hypothetical protein